MAGAGAAMSREDYERGMADGLAGKPPDFDSLALGSNSLNDYERGYVQSRGGGDGED